MNSTKTLKDMLKAVVTEEITGNDNRNIPLSGITADSRAVRSGGLFVAVRGTNVDGHRFIQQAIENGAAVIVAEEFDDNPPEGVTYVRVADSADALGHLASQWYGNPSQHLTLVGVTGTNGKTTIATLLYDMARLNGEKAGLLSTVVNKIGDIDVPSTHTTPDPIELNALLARMVEEGCTFVAMEVSSHAAVQHRISGLYFSGGIFTNLTRDHLDYHKTFKAYLDAKKSFFDMLPPEAFALTNADDRNGSVMLQNTSAQRQSTYSLRSDADFRVALREDRLDGMLLSINGREVETFFVGRFNASNLAAVYGAWVLLGGDPEETLRCLSLLRPVAGRFQPFRSAKGVLGIVDYAHTPDALANVLNTIRETAPDSAHVITVCGCGGDRDRGKRPIMASTAAMLSNRVIITNDNPRTENPRDIIDEMLDGLNDEQHTRTLVIEDRRQAIRTAVALARPGDIILVAGKGHENYQIIGTEKTHFDDREELTAAFDNTNS